MAVEGVDMALVRLGSRGLALRRSFFSGERDKHGGAAGSVRAPTRNWVKVVDRNADEAASGCWDEGSRRTEPLSQA